MSTPPLPDEVAWEAVAAWRAHHRARAAAARSLGLAKSTFDSRLKVAAERGMLLDEVPAMPGFRITKVTTGPDGDQHITQKPEPGEQFAVPNGHAIKGVSAYVDADGHVVSRWIKTKEGALDPAVVAEWLKSAFADVEPAAPAAPLPFVVPDDLLTLIPCNDWHVGMFAWGREASENWDLKIAEKVIGEGITGVIERTPASTHAVVLGGGDLMHSDSKVNATTAGTPQDVDGRYQKVLQTITRMAVRTVNAALCRHQHVTVRILPGNHDEHVSVAIAYFLLAWYRNEPRVTVDTDPSRFWWMRFGRVLLGATHGDTVKLDKMPAIMAHRRAEDWGLTRFRYVHGFHVHHVSKIVTEGEGVICETHQAPIPMDAWHFGSGYLSGRSMQAITYHREFGEKGRVKNAIMDAIMDAG